MKDSAYYLKLGRDLWRAGRYAEAIEAYHEAVALDPESPAAQLIDQANEILEFRDKRLLDP